MPESTRAVDFIACLWIRILSASASDRRAAIDDDGLSGHERSGLRDEINSGPGNLVGFADSPKRRPCGDRLQRLRILPQCPGEVGSYQAWSNAIDADIVLSPFDREIARQLNVGGFGDVIGANYRRALEAADRRNDDDRTVVALQHVGGGHLDQPMVGENVVLKNLTELIVRDTGHRPVVRI